MTEETELDVMIGCVCTHTSEICNDRVDLGVAKQWCSRPRGHEGLHVACAPLADRHQDAVWGRDGRVHDHPFPEGELEIEEVGGDSG